MTQRSPRNSMSLVLALLVLGGAGALAGCRTKPPADIPGEFTFHGVAVHPAAVSALYNSSTGQLDLAAFKTDLEARQWEDQPGWWVADFEEDLTTGRSPFFAYVAFAGPITGGAETYILSVIFNSGQPADVDNIVLLQKNGGLLSLVRTWNEGSACNGGISNQRLEEDNFFYTRELTPVDLLALSPVAPTDLAANQDLEATAESCYASANFVYSLAQDVETLSSIRIYDEPIPEDKARIARFRYQACFDRIINDYIRRGQTVLTPKDLDDLAARFKSECLPPSGTTAPAPAPNPADK